MRLLLLACALLVSAPPAAADCRDRLFAERELRAVAPHALLSADDLIGLRDFGPPGDIPGGERSFALSSDGRHIALLLRRADSAGNRYCIGLVIVSTADGAARIVDTGGEPIFTTYDFRGLADQVNGAVDLPVPAWSPDGNRIAYLRRDGGRTRLWVVDAEGRQPAHALTDEAVDVRRFAWNAASDGLVYAVRRGTIDAEARITAEGRSGYLYDRRFWPMAETRPYLPASIPMAYRTITLAGAAADASTADQAALGPPTFDGVPANAMLRARDANGAVAWVAARHADRYTSPVALTALVDGARFVCDARACAERVIGIWWTAPGELLFLRDWVGEKAGRLEFFRWRPGTQPVSLYETADDLTGCLRGGGALFCTRESACQPRQLVRIDPAAQRTEVVYDPNPQFAGFELGRVTRLPAIAGDGSRGFADLVLPPDHRARARHPLVVVQYNSRGFLRGGTGDEYPIFLLAQRGFAVLSYQRPQSFAFGSDTPDLRTFQRRNVENWADRRRAFTALDSAIDKAIALGVVDPEKIGITGLSDGASTVQWALLNSKRFRAAATSGCCEDPGSVTYGAGIVFQDDIRAYGYPPPGDDQAFWAPFSLARNAARVAAPLLVQASDREYRAGLETVGSLRDAKAPVEMFVFPDEYHLKWQPAHRLAIYARALDWFDFWLRGRVDPDPSKAEQYARWRTLAGLRPVAQP